MASAFQRISRLLSDLVLRLLLTPLCRVVPRDPAIWVFGSWAGTRFSDNAKAAFLAAQGRSDIRAVWITRNAGVEKRLAEMRLPVARRSSLRGLWLSLRAGVYVFDVSPNDINYAASHGALRVNLWHGIPLKKIERDIDTPGHFIFEGLHGGWKSRLQLRLRQPWMFGGTDVVTCTSDELVPIFASAFAIPQGQVMVAGYPRNDQLFAGRDPESLLARAKDAGCRTILYMPTFRDRRPSIVWTEEEQHALDAILARHRLKLFVKLHPIDRSRWRLAKGLSNIDVTPANVDVYGVMAYVDMLVTDYSSIYFDYLLLDRPIVFYCHDLDEYLSQDRGMYFDYDSVTPGPKVRTFAEFAATVESVAAGGGDGFAPQRASVRDRFHKYADDGSARRTLDAICHCQAGVGQARAAGLKPWPVPQA